MFGTPTITDNCDVNLTVTFADDTLAGSCDYNYSITRTWTAVDACGNSSSNSQTITIEDTTPPTLTCAADTTVDCGTPIEFTDPTVSDNCDPNAVFSIVADTTIDNPDGSKSHIRSWVAVDACGNYSDTCSQTITERSCGFCSFTQGFYGNAGGKHCDGRGTEDLINDLLAPGNLVIGGGANRLTLMPGDGACIIQRLPGGGPSKILNGSATCANPVGIQTHPQSGRFRNVLLAQTITYGLNLRLDSNLADLQIQNVYMTTIALAGCVPSAVVPGTEQVFQFPASLFTYLGPNFTVGDLYALANQYLAGNFGNNKQLEGAIVSGLAAINEGFDECRQLVGFSATPPVLARSSSNTDELNVMDELEFKFLAYPNPTNSKVQFEFILDELAEQAILEVYSPTGAYISALFKGEVEAGKLYTAEFNGDELAAGTYIYKFQTSDKVHYGKIVLVK